MAVSERLQAACEAPRRILLDRCVHCGLCLNACPTYRELGLEMDSPRGRIYQMVQVAEGKVGINPAYIQHISLCLACRACETACPSGVQYGRLVEAARAHIEQHIERPPSTRLLRRLVLRRLFPSQFWLRTAGALLYLYQHLGVQAFVRSSGLLKFSRRLAELEKLTPTAEAPFFFRNYGRTFPAEGERRYRVGFLAGCIANVCFARLNEATVRVLQKNGCEVVIPRRQTCCGAIHVHTGDLEQARALARRNIDAFLEDGLDAIITNAAGCGSTLKEYAELFENDPKYYQKAHEFVAKMRDVNEFLTSIELNLNLGGFPFSVTYQDSCHLLHGQKLKLPPRKLLEKVPALRFSELPQADICCGSAGVYNVVHTDMAMQLLKNKMEAFVSTGAEVLVTANTGCLLQLRAGVEMFANGQRVMHVVEVLDEAYSRYRP
jgi:glycolate oxidase iron-sulfur subunit